MISQGNRSSIIYILLLGIYLSQPFEKQPTTFWEKVGPKQPTTFWAKLKEGFKGNLGSLWFKGNLGSLKVGPKSPLTFGAKLKEGFKGNLNSLGTKIIIK
jgi:hypothetical protein